MSLITLLTDFGYKDNYVGVMKGVIYSLCSHCQMVDITHGIPSQDLWSARFNLLVGYVYFPAETIHLVVVDPGVGTGRAAIAAKIQTPMGPQTIVAPDNGILTGFPITSAVTLSNPAYWRTPAPSSTFHGRDIFAPAAAHVANGVSLDQLGASRPVSSLIQLPLTEVEATPQGYRGSICYIDHFGNLVTNIAPNLLGRDCLWPRCQLQIGDSSVPYGTTYGDAEPGVALALLGSHGYVEIAINGGSAAQVFNAQVGDPVLLVSN